MKRTWGIILLAALVAAACGGRTAQTPAQPARRAFPEMEIPAMITGAEDRMAYMALHQWERFTDTSAVYLCDSVTVNGVALQQVEEQMGLFATLLQNIPPDQAREAVERLFRETETFGLRYPESNLFPQLAQLVEKYLYNPNSPLRYEDLYGVYAARLACSPLVPQDYRARHSYDARMCALNPVGSVATDFAFTDLRGKVLSLHGIRAQYTLLIFGNPGCSACRELMEAMEDMPGVQTAIADGRLKVVDIFIDPETDQWKAQGDSFPKNWICGYDHGLAITEQRLYNVRGIPSLYLLDEEKKILFKDAVPESVLAFFENAF